MGNIAKCFDILATSLSVPHNYFDGPTKSFTDLHPAKLSDTLAKPTSRAHIKYLKKKNYRKK